MKLLREGWGNAYGNAVHYFKKMFKKCPKTEFSTFPVLQNVPDALPDPHAVSAAPLLQTETLVIHGIYFRYGIEGSV